VRKSCRVGAVGGRRWSNREPPGYGKARLVIGFQLAEAAGGLLAFLG